MLIPKTYEARHVSWNSTGSILDFRVRLLGRDRRVNGSLIITEDMDNKHYTISAQTFNDFDGSGSYKQTPYSIAEQSICQAVRYFWIFFKNTFKYGVNTDCPFVLNPCPIPKGDYYIKDSVLKTDDWPVIMPRGFLKGVATFKKDGEVISIQEVVIHIVDRL
ncbi:GD23770 [Drosophila simulans]|nr:GD23770 [Drosophila simulans]